MTSEKNEETKPETSIEELKERKIDASEDANAVDHKQATPTDEASANLPTDQPSGDVEAKLKKLSKLDAKYQELLRAYRRAHARNSAIEPFEARLRETTPLASIGDPDAFVDYLTQLKSKEDLVVQELSRVTREKDEYIKKFEGSEQRVNSAQAELESLKKDKPSEGTEELYSVDSEVPRLQSEVHERDEQIQELKSQIGKITSDLESSKAVNLQITSDLEASKRDLEEMKSSKIRAEIFFKQETSGLQLQIEELTRQLQKAPSTVTNQVDPVTTDANLKSESLEGEQSLSKKKKQKKRKKKAGESGQSEIVSIEATATESAVGGAASDNEVFNEGLAKRLEDKDNLIQSLQEKIKKQEDLKEEIEGLRDELITLGQEHVETKESLRQSEAERDQLKSDTARSVNDSETVEAGLQTKSQDLGPDLVEAQELAASRHQEILSLRDLVHKAQPELVSLRSELNELRASREELSAKVQDMHKLEARAETLTADGENLRQELSARDTEARSLKQQVSREMSQRTSVEEQKRNLQRDLQRVQQEAERTVEEKDGTFKELQAAKTSLEDSRTTVKDLEGKFERLNRETSGLRDEISLKTAQHASAESLMSSVRDQAGEMAAQLKEARERCESLEEELSNTHRLMDERGREGETMRRLLADVEGRAEARVKEMRERLDNAVAERDKAEGEANNFQRRRGREIDDLKSKLREVERELRAANEDRSDFENLQRELRRQREADQRRLEQSTKEVADVRAAMTDLKDALDDGEKQSREYEAERENLTRSLEEAQQKVEKLQRSNKVGFSLLALNDPNKLIGHIRRTTLSASHKDAT